jgi:hypothetical protein
MRVATDAGLCIVWSMAGAYGGAAYGRAGNWLS